MPSKRLMIYLPEEVLTVLNEERKHFTLPTYIVNLLYIYVDEIKAANKNEVPGAEPGNEAI